MGVLLVYVVAWYAESGLRHTSPEEALHREAILTKVIPCSIHVMSFLRLPLNIKYTNFSLHFVQTTNRGSHDELNNLGRCFHRWRRVRHHYDHVDLATLPSDADHHNGRHVLLSDLERPLPRRHHLQHQSSLSPRDQKYRTQTVRHSLPRHFWRTEMSTPLFCLQQVSLWCKADERRSFLQGLGGLGQAALPFAYWSVAERLEYRRENGLHDGDSFARSDAAVRQNDFHLLLAKQGCTVRAVVQGQQGLGRVLLFIQLPSIGKRHTERQIFTGFR